MQSKPTQLPGAITPNGDSRFTTNYSYTSFLAATSVSGPNGASSGSGFDSFGRLASATSAHGASTTYSYSYSPPMVTATVNGRWTRTTMDGFGRAVKVEKGDSGSTKSVVDVVYDSAALAPLGLRKSVSRPYAPGAQSYLTSYVYDGRGRVTSVLLPGGTGTNTTFYVGNTQTATDAAGKWKMYTRDVFGNLTIVTEPNPAGGANLTTQHAFDVYNRLKQVSMTRNGTTQTRTFTYDPATQRLSSVQHPESGLASYTYNADGSVAARTDAKGQKVAYSYDSMGRVTQVRRYPNGVSEDPCQRDTYSWDTNPYDGSYSLNAVGRVTGMQYGGSTCSAATLFTDMYSYTPAGRMTGKRLRMNRGSNDADLNASFTYNNEGQLTSKQYPNGGTTYTYGFDSMARPVSLTDSGLRTWVNNVNWNADGRLGQIGVWNGTGYWNETRSFNARGQMTRQTVPGMLDMEYRYSPTANNGQITQSKDWMSNQEVTYSYDSLSRLSSAATTDPSQWGLSFNFDGFGNRTNSAVTQGSGPYFSMAFDPATNRMLGGGIGYDSNGNLTNQPGASYGYDVENRLVNYSNAEYYAYGPGNRRIWKRMPSGAEEVYFYDPSGNRMGVYCPLSKGGTLGFQSMDTNVTFAGKLVNARGSAVLRDRLGSVRATSGANTMYFPFGEEQGSGMGNDREKFGTYYRDQTTGLDYAHNRYYGSQFGAFIAPDKGSAGARLGRPQRWNRYAYVGGDPIRFNDPRGREGCDAGDEYCGESSNIDSQDLQTVDGSPDDLNGYGPSYDGGPDPGIDPTTTMMGDPASPEPAPPEPAPPEPAPPEPGPDRADNPAPPPPDNGQPASKIGWCVVKGAAVGAAGAVVVGTAVVVAAPALGVSAAAASTVLFVAGAAGGVTTGVSAYLNFKSGNYSAGGFDLGSLLGGLAVGGLSGGKVGDAINPPATRGFWSVTRDIQNLFDPSKGSNLGAFMATGPDAAAAGGATGAAGSSGSTLSRLLGCN